MRTDLQPAHFCIHIHIHVLSLSLSLFLHTVWMTETIGKRTFGRAQEIQCPWLPAGMMVRKGSMHGQIRPSSLQFSHPGGKERWGTQWLASRPFQAESGV